MAGSDLDGALQGLQQAVQKYDDGLSQVEPLKQAVLDAARGVVSAVGGGAPAAAGNLPQGPIGAEGGGEEAGFGSGLVDEPPAEEPQPPQGQASTAGPPPAPPRGAARASKK